MCCPTWCGPPGRHATTQKGCRPHTHSRLSAFHSTAGFDHREFTTSHHEVCNHLCFLSASNLLGQWFRDLRTRQHDSLRQVAERAVKHKRLICPNCDGRSIRRSHRKNLIEKAGSLFFIKPFRCMDCNQRFWRYWLPWKTQILLLAVTPILNRTR